MKGRNNENMCCFSARQFPTLYHSIKIILYTIKRRLRVLLIDQRLWLLVVNRVAARYIVQTAVRQSQEAA